MLFYSASGRLNVCSANPWGSCPAKQSRDKQFSNSTANAPLDRSAQTSSKSALLAASRVLSLSDSCLINSWASSTWPAKTKTSWEIKLLCKWPGWIYGLSMSMKHKCIGLEPPFCEDVLLLLAFCKRARRHEGWHSCLWILGLDMSKHVTGGYHDIMESFYVSCRGAVFCLSACWRDSLSRGEHAGNTLSDCMLNKSKPLQVETNVLIAKKPMSISASCEAALCWATAVASSQLSISWKHSWAVAGSSKEWRWQVLNQAFTLFGLLHGQV